MKKLFVIIALFVLVVLPSMAFAAVGTCTPTAETYKNVQRVILTLTCLGGTAGDAGTIANTTISPTTYGISGWYLYSIETDPGAQAPTDNYDIAITDANGFDVTGGLVANRDTSNTELVYLSAVGFPIITGTWTVAITNNSAASSNIVIKLVFIAN